MNRLLHIPMGFDIVAWTTWAEKSGVHPDVVSFTVKNVGDVGDVREELPEELWIKATPRNHRVYSSPL